SATRMSASRKSHASRRSSATRSRVWKTPSSRSKRSSRTVANLSIEVVCPQCGSSHRVNTRLAGRSVHCRECDATVVVPAAAAESAAAADIREVAPPADSGPDAGVAQAIGVAAAAPDPGEASDDPEDTPPVVFASDPVFNAPGHHSPTDLPDLPPALLP